MVDDPATDKFIKWADDGNSFYGKSNYPISQLPRSDDSLQSLIRTNLPKNYWVPTTKRTPAHRSSDN